MAKQLEESEIIYGERFIDDEFMKAVGRMTINFAHLEFTISLLCGSNMKTEYPINAIVTSELSFKQLINITTSILKISFAGSKSKLDNVCKLLNKAFELEQKRNTITHSFYGTSEEDAPQIIRHKLTSKSKAGFKRQLEVIDSEAINSLADEINEVSTRLTLVIFEYPGAQKVNEVTH